MKFCANCRNKGRSRLCSFHKEYGNYAENCNHYVPTEMTNFEYVTSSDELLAKFIEDWDKSKGVNVLDWLRSIRSNYK